MADNVAITPGTGTTVAADEVVDGTLGTVKVQFVKLMDGTLDGTGKALVDGNGLAVGVSASGGVGSLTETAPASDTASSGLNGRLQRVAQRLSSLIGQVPAALGQTTKSGSLSVTLASDDATVPTGTTITTTITRPANVTAYAANQTLADSTTVPTAGGFTFSGAARVSGGSGLITDAIVVSTNDVATDLQGEVWIFDSSVTAVNDGSAFTLSDGDAVKLVGVIPFVLTSTMAGSGNNSSAWVSNLGLGFTCVGAADLRYLVKVKNAYTPASGEQITVRLKIQRTS